MSVDESKCASCGHVRRTYKRRLPKGDLIALYDIWQRTREGDTWVHIKDLQGKSGGGDFAKFRYWELIAQRINDDPRKKDSGFWCLTNKGASFIADEELLYSHAIVREGECVGFSGTLISAPEAFSGAGFSYPELMSKADGELLLYTQGRPTSYS
mgnify:CR=1 FL=1